MTMSAAWTPDLPDAGTVASPSEAIAEGFQPESLDHFENVESATCDAWFSAIQRVTVRPGQQEWYRQDLRCGEDAGHFPASPHRSEVIWGAAESIPQEPACADCADVGVQPGGVACHCAAGQPFREAEARKLAQDRPTRYSVEGS